MPFPTDDIYLGSRSFGRRKGTEGVIWHSTEAGGPSRADAIGTANFQKTNLGSYNFIIYDGGILLTVPYEEASGGVAPTSAAWSPGRFPWLKQLLSPQAYFDPNAYLLNVAFSGKARDLAAGRYPDNMLETAARLTLWVEDTFGIDAVMTAHANWQTDRSDPGAGVVDRIIELYNEIVRPPPTPEPPPPTREERLAAEVIDLRTRFPDWAAEWVRNTGMTQDIDGQPLTRERRLSAEVTFLRKAAG
jgi:N-acetylmuramoyl-L-alanine amidase